MRFINLSIMMYLYTQQMNIKVNKIREIAKNAFEIYVFPRYIYFSSSFKTFLRKIHNLSLLAMKEDEIQ
jgi:hypothetical protein